MCPNRLNTISEFEEFLMSLGGILSWEYDRNFFKSLKKCDNSVFQRIMQKIEKIFKNPKVGRRMSSNRKGQREVYVTKSTRLYYYYCEKDNMIVFYEFSHKDDQ